MSQTETRSDEAMKGHEGVGGRAGALAKSREFCRELTKREARNFYYGLKLLPEPKRSAMYALYGYMRLVDDIADDDGEGRSVEQRREELDRWEMMTQRVVAEAGGGMLSGHSDRLGESESPAAPLSMAHGSMTHTSGEPRQDADATGLDATAWVWPAFGEMVRRYRVPGKVFADMIAGQRQDLEPVAIPNCAALHEYCYRVASVVGVASLYVFGFTGGEETLKLGVDRGIAFQLTNILRDLREDAGPPRGRCYLPADEMGRFGVTAAALARGEAERGFGEMMAFQIARAREFYARSAALESRVDADARPTLSAMTEIYRGILERIARDPEAVLRGRVRLSAWAKLRIGWRAMRGK